MTPKYAVGQILSHWENRKALLTNSSTFVIVFKPIENLAARVYSF
jgi:hypothetical protein